MARFVDMTLALIRQRAGAAHEFLQVAEERIELIRADSGESAEAQVAASNAINGGISACDAIAARRSVNVRTMVTIAWRSICSGR